MTSVQRFVKYLALGLAALIIVSLFKGIYYFGNLLFDNEEPLKEYKTFEISKNPINLDIDIKSSNLIIKTGEFKIETNSPSINIKNGNKLVIKDRKRSHKNEITTILYVPKFYEFNNVSIKAGAGNISLNNMTTYKAEINIGAGKIDIDSINVKKESDIEVGAGKLVINNGNLNNLDLEIGAGKATINADITGSSSIECGAGALELNLTKELINYHIIPDKGIGSIKLNNEKIKSDIFYGTGNNNIDIEGGVGKIDITTNENHE